MGPALLPDNLGRLRKSEAAKVIAEGRPATQMAGFAAQLSEADIKALAEIPEDIRAVFEGEGKCSFLDESSFARGDGFETELEDGRRMDVSVSRRGLTAPPVRTTRTGVQRVANDVALSAGMSADMPSGWASWR